MRVLVLANRDFVLYNFRVELLDRLLRDDNEVYICLPNGPKVKYMTEMGCRYIPISIDKRGTNPFKDAQLIKDYKSIFREVKPDIILTYTTKVCIYAGIGAMFTAYCKALGEVCAGVDSFPAVAEGQISPGPCPDGYEGYSYRNCSNGAFGEIQTDHCTYKAPAMVRYRSGRLTLVKGTMVSEKPSYVNIVTKWSMDDSTKLPDGLSLNEETGEISGVPVETQDYTTYTIYAENPVAAATVTVSIMIRKGHCNAEGVFPLTEVDEVAVYQCSKQGYYVGSQKRGCVLGATDGEWEKANGFCMSIASIVILVIVTIIIVAVIVLLLMRAGRKTKAVGGVKGKKVVKNLKKNGTV